MIQTRDISRDTYLQGMLELDDGRRLSALEVLEHYLQAVRSHLKDHGRPVSTPQGDPLRPDLATLADGADADGARAGTILAFWEASLASLHELQVRYAGGHEPGESQGAAGHLEWIAKKRLLDATARRHPGAGRYDTLHAVDLAWSELSPAGRGLTKRVSAGVNARGRLSGEMAEVVLAEPPTTTQVWLRGRLVSDFPGQVVATG